MATSVKLDVFDPLNDPRVMVFRLVNRRGKSVKVYSPSLGEISEVPMLLNPSSFTRTMEQLQTPIKTIGGYVIQHWGHKPDIITASGKTPAFFLTLEDLKGILTSSSTKDYIAASPGDLSTAAAISERVDTPQLAAKNRHLSQGYKEFRKLLDVFRHNGIETDRTTGMINKILWGSVEILYQGTVYSGYFDSFEEEEIDEDPYSISYSFSFNVLKEITPLSMRDDFPERLNLSEDSL